MTLKRMTDMHRSLAWVKALALVALFGLATLAQAAAMDEPLKLGTTAAFAPPLEAAVAEAEKQGLKVELIEFSDWIAPNVSLANGDIDVNYFQHIPFLENAKREAGYDLIPYAPGIINNVGLYSKQYKRFEDLPDGARVAIANDPVNGGRGLQLLEKAGLITLKPGVGYQATQEDILSNPRNIQIIELEAVQLVRAYDDVDLVQGYPAYIRLAKTFDPYSALLFDGLDHPEYVIQFVIRPDHGSDERLRRFVDIYQHSPAVRAALDKAHGTLYQTGWRS
jgi:D-methionine transport system substrate-binding protein